MWEGGGIFTLLDYTEVLQHGSTVYWDPSHSVSPLHFITMEGAQGDELANLGTSTACLKLDEVYMCLSA